MHAPIKKRNSKKNWVRDKGNSAMFEWSMDGGRAETEVRVRGPLLKTAGENAKGGLIIRDVLRV